VKFLSVEEGQKELWMAGFGIERLFISSWDNKARETFRREASLPPQSSFFVVTLDLEHNAILSGMWERTGKLGDLPFEGYPKSHIVAKLGIDGRWLWANHGLYQWPPPTVASAAIVLSPAGDFFITGRADLPFLDLFITHHTSSGQLIDFYSTQGYRSIYGGLGIAVDQAGNPYTAGYGEGYVLDPNKRWAALILGPGFRYEIRSVWRNDRNFARGICVDDKNRVYVTGDFQGRATFGTELIGEVDGSPSHAFVMRIDDAVQKKD
jgi:hypothetical protein